MAIVKPVHRDGMKCAPRPTPHKPDCGPTLTVQGKRAVYKQRVAARDRLYTAASALDERCAIELHPAIALPTHLTAQQIDDLQRVAAWLRGKAEKLNEELEQTCERGNPSGQQTTFFTGE